MDTTTQTIIEIQGLELGYDDHPVLHDLNFTVKKGDIFIVMGVSGCGKSTLFKSLIGLKSPMQGKISYYDKSFWDEDESGQQNIQRRFGILYQGGALWSSMTLGENIALPLRLHTKSSSRQIRELVQRHKNFLINLTV
jgi:phospholipid/cholesterol/gamma-HCH transport system ATP-binding protein